MKVSVLNILNIILYLDFLTIQNVIEKIRSIVIQFKALGEIQFKEENTL
jgi:hypothetical protein